MKDCPDGSVNYVKAAEEATRANEGPLTQHQRVAR